MSRLQTRFAQLKEQNRAALVTFVTAGDPGYDTSLAILKGLPAAGADVIELGMPFTDKPWGFALVVLLFFGGKKIPELMKGLGKGVRSFKEGMNNMEKEIEEEPVKKE